MSCILHIETSTKVCSVAVTQDGAVLFEKVDKSGPSHAVQLGVFVDEALSYVDNHGIPFDAVAVSCGPGSYTGLRIGVSMAKGICYARDLRLIAVPTLELLCVPVLLYNDELPEDALLCPMIDARRMEVYAAVYDRALKTVRPIGADIVDADTYRDFLDARPVYFFGDGAEKCRSAVTHLHAHFLPDILPLAKNMGPLAEKAFALGRFEDVAYFEPFYLKEFVASKPKKLL
ncbi:MAG: tRNA (adenosine(37)-N6)-threonylcarbamoyltransferase complex dimerization subunit type 1 TsaB [Paraprevotella sp.]|nr:tRNA (adenosine(37)-N6)-threonylcarbamoyltransferase complex dimerization subunit type 1 TsaB [Paraprevotella sp.]